MVTPSSKQAAVDPFADTDHRFKEIEAEPVEHDIVVRRASTRSRPSCRRSRSCQLSRPAPPRTRARAKVCRSASFADAHEVDRQRLAARARPERDRRQHAALGRAVELVTTQPRELQRLVEAPAPARARSARCCRRSPAAPRAAPWHRPWSTTRLIFFSSSIRCSCVGSRPAVSTMHDVAAAARLAGDRPHRRSRPAGSPPSWLTISMWPAARLLPGGAGAIGPGEELPSARRRGRCRRRASSTLLFGADEVARAGAGADRFVVLPALADADATSDRWLGVCLADHERSPLERAAAAPGCTARAGAAPSPDRARACVTRACSSSRR